MTDHISAVAARIGATEDELREVIAALRPHIAPCCGTQDCGISEPDWMHPNAPRCAHIPLITTVIGMVRKARSGQVALNGALATARTNLALAEAQLKEVRAFIAELAMNTDWSDYD